jgi:cell division protein ZapA
MTEDKKTVVKVTIGNEEYTLKSDRPAEYTRAVAEHVDTAVKEILSAGARVETHKAAILAALAITDELFQERRATRELADRVTFVGYSHLPNAARESAVRLPRRVTAGSLILGR